VSQNDNCHCAWHYKTCGESLKRKALRRPRKTDIEGADVTCWDRLFQVWAAVSTGKAWSPTVDSRVWRTFSDSEEADRRRLLTSKQSLLSWQQKSRVELLLAKPIALRTTYGITTELNRRKCRVWNSNGHVTTLSVAVPDAELSSIRFIAVHCVVAERYMLQQVSEEVNRKCPPRNTTVQLSISYTYTERHNTHRRRQTDGQTDDSIVTIADHTALRCYIFMNHEHLQSNMVVCITLLWPRRRSPQTPRCPVFRCRPCRTSAAGDLLYWRGSWTADSVGCSSPHPGSRSRYRHGRILWTVVPSSLCCKVTHRQPHHFIQSFVLSLVHTGNIVTIVATVDEPLNNNNNNSYKGLLKMEK